MIIFFFVVVENLGYVQQAVVLAEDNKYPIADEMSGILVWRWRLIVEMLMDETSATWAWLPIFATLCVVKFKIRPANFN